MTETRKLAAILVADVEGVAAPGAICLSEDAYRQVRARLDLVVTDMGETPLARGPQANRRGSARRCS